MKQDGLVHISKMSRRFVKNPMDIVSVGDIVDVWIIQVDENKGKVSLSMVDPNE
ncbi:S1 RNA-binding domain-containing protein [Dorea formicigenerans]|uniref:S1 RNA-binding domain-containing protein n=1 Tax=Dorea formicigenerans TaxID=39486 RepID=UPI002FE6D599